MGKKRNVEERIDQGDIIEVEMAESVDRLNVEGEEGESKIKFRTQGIGRTELILTVTGNL